MTHEEYVATARTRAAQVAQSMLDGSIDFLVGAVEIAALRYEIEVPEDDPDIMAFVLISSEVDGLPIGAVRAHWSDESLAKLQPEVDRATNWARQIATTECQSFVRRFGGTHATD